MSEDREIRYQVVSCQDLEVFERRVNKLMREGWEPLGGVVVVNTTFGPPGLHRSQAMVLPQSQCSFSESCCAVDEHGCLAYVGSLT